MSVCLVNSLVTAQRYASVICAVALCPCLSVCLLQVGVLSKWPNEQQQQQQRPFNGL